MPKRTKSSSKKIPQVSREVYEAEKILDMKIWWGKRFYLIKWKDYDISDATWEPISNLQYILSDLLAYEDENKQCIKEEERTWNIKYREKIVKQPLEQFCYKTIKKQANQMIIDAFKKEKSCSKVSDDYDAEQIETSSRLKKNKKGPIKKINYDKKDDSGRRKKNQITRAFSFNQKIQYQNNALSKQKQRYQNKFKNVKKQKQIKNIAIETISQSSGQSESQSESCKKREDAFSKHMEIQNIPKQTLAISQIKNQKKTKFSLIPQYEEAYQNLNQTKNTNVYTFFSHQNTGKTYSQTLERQNDRKNHLNFSERSFSERNIQLKYPRPYNIKPCRIQQSESLNKKHELTNKLSQAKDDFQQNSLNSKNQQFQNKQSASQSYYLIEDKKEIHFVNKKQIQSKSVDQGTLKDVAILQEKAKNISQSLINQKEKTINKKQSQHFKFVQNPQRAQQIHNQHFYSKQPKLEQLSHNSKQKIFQQYNQALAIQKELLQENHIQQDKKIQRKNVKQQNSASQISKKIVQLNQNKNPYAQYKQNNPKTMKNQQKVLFFSPWESQVAQKQVQMHRNINQKTLKQNQQAYIDKKLPQNQINDSRAIPFQFSNSKDKKQQEESRNQLPQMQQAEILPLQDLQQLSLSQSQLQQQISNKSRLHQPRFVYDSALQKTKKIKKYKRSPRSKYRFLHRFDDKTHLKISIKGLQIDKQKIQESISGGELDRLISNILTAHQLQRHKYSIREVICSFKINNMNMFSVIVSDNDKETERYISYRLIREYYPKQLLEFLQETDKILL